MYYRPLTVSVASTEQVPSVLQLHGCVYKLIGNSTVARSLSAAFSGWLLHFLPMLQHVMYLVDVLTS